MNQLTEERMDAGEGKKVRRRAARLVVRIDLPRDGSDVGSVTRTIAEAVGQAIATNGAVDLRGRGWIAAMPKPFRPRRNICVICKQHVRIRGHKPDCPERDAEQLTTSGG